MTKKNRVPLGGKLVHDAYSVATRPAPCKISVRLVGDMGWWSGVFWWRNRAKIAIYFYHFNYLK
jgi:hypothetical protein